MKNIIYLLFCLPFLFTACDVHEWPDTPETVKFHLRLNYETDMTEWFHLYDGIDVVEQGYGETYDNHQKSGQIRYIVRAYPVLQKQGTAQSYTREFIFTKNIREGYDHEVWLELPAGSYKVMVWSDLVSSGTNPYFHNADNFAEIVLQGEHQGNTDYRDAFRGTGNIELVADIVERVPDTLVIAMERPLAKFEFVTTDLQEFYREEIEYLKKVASSRGDELPTRVNTDNYRVVVLYAGFMPNTYNMNSDKPVDSYMGVFIETKMNVLGDQEASLGFDYVFIGDKKSSILVQIGLYDQEERQVALSDPINVPLDRGFHTILKGSFLMQQASGGIVINPEFDGNFNIEVN